jgi:hypothetical protein
MTNPARDSCRTFDTYRHSQVTDRKGHVARRQSFARNVLIGQMLFRTNGSCFDLSLPCEYAGYLAHGDLQKERERALRPRSTTGMKWHTGMPRTGGFWSAQI